MANTMGKSRALLRIAQAKLKQQPEPQRSKERKVKPRDS